MQCGRASHGSRDLLEAVILSGTVRKWKYIFFCISYVHFSNLTSFLNPSLFRFITALNPLIMWKWDILIYDLYICLAVSFFKELNSTSVCTWRLIPGVLLHNAILQFPCFLININMLKTNTLKNQVFIKLLKRKAAWFLEFN